MSGSEQEPESVDERVDSSASAQPQSVPPSARKRRRPRWTRRRQRLVVAAIAPVLLLFSAFAIARASHRGEVLSGVFVGDVDLSGADRAAAARELRLLAARLRADPVPVQVADSSFELDPASVAYEVDVEQTLARALAAGREGSVVSQLGWWLKSWSRPHRVPVVGTVDSTELHRVIAAWEREAIEGPAFEGEVVARAGRVAAEYPRAGRGVDRTGLEQAVLDGLGSPRREPLSLPIVTAEPRRSRATVDDAVRRARKLVSADVVLVAAAPLAEAQDGAAPKSKAGSEPAAPDSKHAAKGSHDAGDAGDGARELVVRFSREQLLAALRSRSSEGSDLALDLYFDAEAIEPSLKPARPELERPPQDASFRIDERDRIEVVPSRPGSVVDAKRVAAALLAAAQTPDRRGRLPVDVGEAPTLTTEQARALGIRELVSEYSTHHPCCRPRVKNIHRIADLVDGTVVKPGETFSLNDLVGQRTKKKGFVLAPGIEEGEMVDSVGGGISQFATTLFNAVLYGGYDVIERAPHTWYFRRYPMGWDATLSFPKPDLTFRNDTKAGLLIKTEYSGTTIAVKLYGNAEGRKVQTKKSHPTDVVQPPIKYVADASLEPDERKTEYRGRVGWSVHVSRTVVYADGTSKKQRRKITYKPRPKEVRVHPCKIPKGEEGYTGRPCPKPPGTEEEEDAEPPERDKPQRKPKDKPREPPPVEPPPVASDGAGASGSAADLIPPELLGD